MISEEKGLKSYQYCALFSFLIIAICIDNIATLAQSYLQSFLLNFRDKLPIYNQQTPQPKFYRVYL